MSTVATTVNAQAVADAMRLDATQRLGRCQLAFAKVFVSEPTTAGEALTLGEALGEVVDAVERAEAAVNRAVSAYRLLAIGCTAQAINARAHAPDGAMFRYAE